MTAALRLDHVAICAETLESGAAHVEAALGVPLAPGGRHEGLGTHNRLLSLGPEHYLEVIAADPGQPTPGVARLLGLDAFMGAPRPGGWVLSTDDLEAALAAAVPGLGAPRDLARGDIRWRMTLLPEGRLPFDGLHPALIEWRSPRRPPAGLPDRGCRLLAVQLWHPQAEALAAALKPLGAPLVRVGEGVPAMAFEIETPGGVVTLAG